MSTLQLSRNHPNLHGVTYDMLVGDPLSGAAYGEKLKSKGLGMVIGVVAAVVTMGAAAPLLASSVMAYQIAGGVMMAGGVLSGVGAVTGNKKLAKIGGVMSLAGGIGAGVAGLAGAGAEGATGMMASGSGSEALSTFSSNFMSSAKDVTGGLLYSTSGSDAAIAERAGEFASAKAGDSATTLGLAGAEQGGAPVTDATTSTVGTTKPPVAGELPLGTQAPAPVTNLDTKAPASLGGKVNAGTGGGGILDFAKENPEAFKVGAGALKDFAGAALTSDTTNAQTQELLNRAKAYDAQAALLGTQNEMAQFQLANQNKKSVMLSADDPQLDAKMAQAKADGASIGIIPSIGKGMTQTPTTGINNAAQTVRAPTFAPQQAAGVLNRATS